MSIKYTFTDRGSIKIECGTDTLEILLPNVVGHTSTDTAGEDPESVDQNTPHGNSATPTAGAADDKKARRKPIPKGFKPPIYPGAMLVIANGKMPQGDGLFPEEAPDTYLALSEVEGKPTHDLLLNTKRIGGLSTLDLLVDHPIDSDSPEMKTLKDLLDDPGIPLDALRLWQK